MTAGSVSEMHRMRTRPQKGLLEVVHEPRSGTTANLGTFNFHDFTKNFITSTISNRFHPLKAHFLQFLMDFKNKLWNDFLNLFIPLKMLIKTRFLWKIRRKNKKKCCKFLNDFKIKFLIKT